MGQFIIVTVRLGVSPSVRIFDLNRSLTGMAIERYPSIDAVKDGGDRAPDVLARRLFDLGATGVTVYSSTVAVTAGADQWDALEPKVVCAGHTLPLRLRQDGSVEAAAEPQPLLGVMDDLELYEQMVTLDPGDVLLCVTDGVTERREGTRMLGDEGLIDVLANCTGLTAGAVK